MASLDERMARLEQRVADIDNRGSRGVMRLETMVVRMDERLQMTGVQLTRLAEDVEQREREAGERAAEERRERRQNRIAMWTLSVMILTAILSAGVVIITSGVH